MGGGPPGFPRGFTCPVVLRVRPGESQVSATGFHRLWRAFPDHFAYRYPLSDSMWDALQPRTVQLHRRFGLFPVRSPLLRESLLLSFPRGTKMFQFPRSALSLPYGFRLAVPALPPVGCPIRKSPDQRSAYGSPRHYRCSPRPSSAPGAKASTVCPYSLNLSSVPSGDSLAFLYPIFKVHLHCFLVELSGIEPLASCLQGRRSPN